MEGGKESVKQLGSKIEKLISLHQAALKEVDSLTKKNKFLTEELTLEQEKVRDLENKIATSSFVNHSNVSNNEETQSLKEKVDGLIQEVDECIALLNK